MTDENGRIALAVIPGTSAEAIDTAFGLAAEQGVPLLAVRAWHDPDLPLGGWLPPERTARWDAAHRTVRHELDRALAQARAAHPSVDVTTVVVDDDPVAFLTALSTRARLLVLGRSGAGGRSPLPSTRSSARRPARYSSYRGPGSRPMHRSARSRPPEADRDLAALDSGVAGPFPLSGERSMVLPMTGGSSWARHLPAAAG